MESTLNELEFLNVSNQNFTKHWHLEEEQGTSPGMIVLFIVSFTLVILVGCPLLLSIVHFEHFGNDPQKRRLSNMILTNLCIFTIFQNIFMYICLTFRIIFGPLYHFIVNIIFCAILTMAGGQIASLMFGLILKNLEILKPNFILSLNDYYGYFLLNSATLLFDIPYTLYFSLKMDEIPYYYPMIGESSHIHFELPQNNSMR